jgi:peptidylprolyl isomerase
LLAIGMIAGMAGTRCPARTPAQSPGWMGSCASENKAGSGATRASDHATTGTPAAAARPKSADSAATPVLSLSGVATADGPDTNTVGWIALPSGARYQEIHVGKGRIPSPGVAVHLHMKIFDSRGKLIQNTFADRAAYIFTYGRDEVFPAFEEAVASMREGGKRRIVFPPEIGFWSQGYDDEERDVHIERDATLLFEVSFMWLREPEFDKIGIFK